MKYWVFQNNQVTGPYPPDDLTQVPGYSGETLVCAEGRKGTSMGDWQRASMVPELSLSIIKAGQLAVALKGSGGYGGLPPEPTLKDLAALGSLQEKVSLLDNTVGHLQESLRLKDEELLSVHKELEDKTRYAQELSVKLGGLEERFTAVNQLREGLDRAVQAEHGMESTVEKQAKLIEDLSSQLRALRDEQRQMDELRAELSTLKQKQESERQETERKLGEARAAAEEASKKAAEAAAKPASVPSPPADPAPLGLKPEPSPAERLGLPSERPSPLGGAELTLDAPAPLTPIGLAEAKPLEPLGAAAPLGPATPLEPLGGALDLTASGDLGLPALGASNAAGQASKAPAPVVPDTDLASPPPAKKKPMALVAVAVVAVAALGAVKLGLLGGKKQAAELPVPPVADQAPLPPPPAPAPEAPRTITAEELAEQEKQAAIALVKSQPLPRTTATLGATLEAQAPPNGGLSPWMADKGKDGRYQVNFYAPKSDSLPPLTYEFDVSLADQKVSARNKTAQALLSGRALDAAVGKKPVRVAKRGKPKMPRIRPKKAPASDDSGLLQDLLSVDDKPAPKASAKAAGPQAAPAEGEGGGDVLVDGSGHSAEPIQAQARPARPAPQRAAEKRNVDQELDDLLADGQEKTVKKPAAPKEESLDELLEPGSQKPADAAPVAEPAAEADQTAQAAPAPKRAAKPKRKPQAADAELLDDLLKP